MPSRPILPQAVAIAVARMNIPHKLIPESHAAHAANDCHTYGYWLPIHPYGYNPQPTEYLMYEVLMQMLNVPLTPIGALAQRLNTSTRSSFA
ncbi:hypothetical protein CSIM01_12009 [Colletotrichum simmondsii]|uniref:Uncharacterized protein n=1 Tax=Colletotrichum simmondsii TaxID=703756 RepID=A0A135T6T6_9PEZI|nr:hypothetical protein CSIM01_12009 [Colletotrichum simmondsii]